MTSAKQQLVIYILSKGKYRVDAEKGILQSFRCNGWFDVVPRIQPDCGKKQHTISHEGTKVIVYLHVLVWISQKGVYKPGKVVHHIDEDMGNCAISNLELVTHKKNIKYSLKNRAPKREGDNSHRGEVITKIREKLAEGKNQSEIARDLGLKRLGVRYIVKKIEAGEPLKFEGCPKLKIKSVTSTVIEKPEGEFKSFGSPGYVVTGSQTIIWEDMTKEEVAAEAIPHYTEKFKI